MQSLVIPTGDHNPQGFTEAQILSALRAESGARQFSFRYELLDSGNRKLSDLDNILSGKIDQNWLADIKRKASFQLASQGGIDFLSNRIKPWIRMHLPPWGEDDYVEWPQGVFLLSTPQRSTDLSDTVYRDVEGYDQTQIYLDDKIEDRFAAGSQDQTFESLVTAGLYTDGEQFGHAQTPDTADLDITGDITLIGYVQRDDWQTIPADDDTVISKYNTVGNQRSYTTGYGVSGFLFASISSDGTSGTLQNYIANAAPLPNASGEVIYKFELDVNDGSGQSIGTFFTGPTVDGPWTQLGDPDIGTSTTIHAGTAAVVVGGRNAGGASNFEGIIKRTIIKNGIGGGATTVLDIDFTQQAIGTSGFTDSTGRVWTVNPSHSAIVNVADTTDSIRMEGTWAAATDEFFRGTTSFKSRTITHGEATTTLIDLRPGTHTVNFAYKVSSEEDFDILSVRLDGDLLLSASGEVDWTQASLDVTGGTELTFEYTKDSSVTEGSDAAWIDDISLVGGVKYTDVISDVLGSSVQKNITTSSSTLPEVKEWKPGTEKLTIINDLLGAINYESLSFDESGLAVVQPYVTPPNRSAEYTYQDDELSVMYPEVMQELDLFSIANRWVLVVSDPDRGLLTSTYTNTDPASPTSTVRRQRVIVDFREEQDASDQLTLDAKAARLAFEASQIYEAIEFTTGIMPIHSGNDVYKIVYDPLALNSKYTEHTWSMDLSSGASMSHRARRVVTV